MSPPNLSVGLCTIANKEATVEEVVAAAADCGYDGVEIWGKDPLVGDGSPETCDRIREVAARRSLDIAVYGSYLRPGTESFASEMDRELRIAADLGASLIRVWPGSQEFQERTSKHWRRTVSDLRTLSEKAAELDIAVTVEKHEGTLSNTTEGTQRLIEAVDSEHWGLNWQPLFSMPGDDLIAEAHTLAPLSKNVHSRPSPTAEPESVVSCRTHTSTSRPFSVRFGNEPLMGTSKSSS